MSVRSSEVMEAKEAYLRRVRKCVTWMNKGD